MDISPVYRRLYKSLLFGFVVAVATVSLGALPEDDLIQGIWVFLSTSIAALVAFRQRLKEDDEQRYARLAKSYFKYWIKKDPKAIEGLFASNVPYSVVRWLQKEAGCDLSKCDCMHSVDSWARFGDEPGELIFRAGLNFGKMLGETKVSSQEAEKIISQKLKSFTEDSLSLLGEEIHPNVFYKEIKEDDCYPAGIHMSNSKSECLAVLIREKRGEKQLETFNKISFGLKREYLESISDDEWEMIKRDIIYPTFPFFKPVNGGSGPQKKLVPLFLTEKNLTEAMLKDFPQQAITAYTKVKEFVAAKNPPKQEDDAGESDEND